MPDMSTTRQTRKVILFSILLPIVLSDGLSALVGWAVPTIAGRHSSTGNWWAQPTLRASQPGPSDKPARVYFTIQVIDRQTGRGVPLVELRTTNSIRLFTDSNGIVAFLEPGLMDREVFFFVESHGYEVPKDGFGYRGVRLRTTPGEEATVKIDRLNIAERLYRVTGQGIYRDSVLTGWPVPLKNPVLSGQVMGQDSVDNCIYHGRLFWFWGDTGRPSYPLGHFAMAGAVSDLPGRGGLDPAIGVNLEYFVNKDGFSRPMSPLKEPGLVWLDGFLVVKDHEGRERMLAKFARLKDLGHVLERGIVAFNDATQSFEPLVRSDPNLLPYPDFGHAFPVTAEGREYWYFALPFPLTVRMRVEAKWENVIDPNRYEVLTAVPADFVGRAAPLATYRWARFSALVGKDTASKAKVIAALQREKKDTRFYDMESGKPITPHGGSVYYNAYRRKWIAIFVQAGGTSSYLGEVWYAEADTPVGPWAYARQVATHNKYSFYNPKQHPYFDQDGGRTIYFEGTYSWTFSGSEERATPRYDYNQIMYRLNLDDPRLTLPAPVYVVSVAGQRDGVHGTPYLAMGDTVARTDTWDLVESVPFYAVEPNRTADGLIAVYAQNTWRGRPALDRTSPNSPYPKNVAPLEERGQDGLATQGRDALATNGRTVRLTTQSEASAQPLFLGLPPKEGQNTNACIVPLYEYHHAGTGQFRYSPEASLQQEGWERAERPLCRVWKTPAGPLLIDAHAKPADRF